MEETQNKKVSILINDKAFSRWFLAYCVTHVLWLGMRPDMFSSIALSFAFWGILIFFYGLITIDKHAPVPMPEQM